MPFTEEELAQRKEELSKVNIELAKKVTEHGPEICNLGMPWLEGQKAVLACIDRLLEKIALAKEILSSPHVTITEERDRKLVEEFYARD